MRVSLLIITVGVLTPTLCSLTAATEERTASQLEKSVEVRTSKLARIETAETALPDSKGDDDPSSRGDSGPAKPAHVAAGDMASAASGMSPKLLVLRMQLLRCLAHYVHRPGMSSRLCPWEVMHCAVGFGVDAQLMYRSKPYNAIAWLCENLPCQGMRMLYTQDGQLRVRGGEGYEGHAGQFLAILAQSRVNNRYPLIVDDQKFMVADLIEHEQLRCRSATELSYQLIGLSHYLDTEAEWKNDLDEKWNIPRLIKEELAQSVVDSSCGGTHRMMAFSYAVQKRAARGKPMTGQWYRAKVYVDDFHKYTFQLQNPDGSFSTAWFRGRQDWSDVDRKLTTTGHMLEWLIHSLPEEELVEPSTVKGVSFLADLLWKNRHREWDVGPLGHGLHALTMYDERVFGGRPGHRAEGFAKHSPDSSIQVLKRTRIVDYGIE